MVHEVATHVSAGAHWTMMAPLEGPPAAVRPSRAGMSDAEATRTLPPALAQQCAAEYVLRRRIWRPPHITASPHAGPAHLGLWCCNIARPADAVRQAAVPCSHEGTGDSSLPLPDAGSADEVVGVHGRKILLLPTTSTPGEHSDLTCAADHASEPSVSPPAASAVCWRRPSHVQGVAAPTATRQSASAAWQEPRSPAVRSCLAPDPS